MNLNVEQKSIVTAEPKGHLLIKGVAGSGKTTIGVARANYLLNNHCPEEEDKVLLVTYNKTLLNYLKFLYEKIDKAENDVDVFNNKKIEIINIDSLMYRYFINNNRRNKVSYKLVPRNVENKILKKAIEKTRLRYPNVDTLDKDNLKFLKYEISWIKGCGIVDEDEYLTIDRLGRSSGKEGPQRLAKNSDVRKSIFYLMNEYDRQLEEKKYVTFDRYAEIALEEVKLNKNEKYTHIIVDEAQDLSKVKLLFINELISDKEYASLTISSDNTQSIYENSWLGKGRSYSTVGFNIVGNSTILKKNYRTTTEISKAAFDLVRDDENINSNMDYIEPSLMDRRGHHPIFKEFSSMKLQYDFIFEEINKLIKEYDLEDICIVGKENKLLKDCVEYLREKNLEVEELSKKKPNYGNKSVKFTTIHSIKGLEFKVIFLIDLNEGIIPNELADNDEFAESEERKLLYVGMTRAEELLYLTSSSVKSRFIDDISLDNLRFEYKNRTRPFYELNNLDYKHVDMINNINGKEEVVRQWILNEIIENYSYPLETIELEYGLGTIVNRNYCDLVVKDKNGDAFIIVETKQFGLNLEEGLNQLKDYMMKSRTCEYGVLTNGLELIVLDKFQNEVCDIPLYEEVRNRIIADCSTENNAEEYIDLQTNTKYSYLEIEKNNMVKIPLIGEVAAGIPTLAIENYEDMINVPLNSINSYKDSFILRVTGDSMNGSGIDKGDYVLVNKQSNVCNGDICIALINESATMKEVRFMGDTILLLPSNPNYEPIQMDIKDVFINGKVIGVIKR